MGGRDEGWIGRDTGRVGMRVVRGLPSPGGGRSIGLGRGRGRGIGFWSDLSRS